MKNLLFSLFVFPFISSYTLPAQELISTHPAYSYRATSTPTKNRASKKDQQHVKGMLQDSISDADRIILSAEYQSIDHTPSHLIMTKEGQTYTWSAKGIKFWDGTTKINITTENAHIPENNITTLALDPDDHLWIGTSSQGIVKGTGYPVKPFKTKIIPTHDPHIFSIVAGHSDGMWVTYRDGGYEYFQNGMPISYFPGPTTK